MDQQSQNSKMIAIEIAAQEKVNVLENLKFTIIGSVAAVFAIVLFAQLNEWASYAFVIIYVVAVGWNLNKQNMELKRLKEKYNLK